MATRRRAEVGRDPDRVEPGTVQVHRQPPLPSGPVQVLHGLQRLHGATTEVVRVLHDHAGRADLVGAAMESRVGGMQLPYTAYLTCMAWFYAANIGTAGYKGERQARVAANRGTFDERLDHGAELPPAAAPARVLPS